MYTQKMSTTVTGCNQLLFKMLQLQNSHLEWAWSHNSQSLEKPPNLRKWQLRVEYWELFCIKNMRLTYFSLLPSHYLAVLRTLYLSSILLCISTIVLVWVRLRFYSFQIFFNSHWVVPTWRLIRLLPYSITESSNKVLGCFLFHQLCTFEKLCNLIRISKFHSWQTWEALHNKNSNNNDFLSNIFLHVWILQL